MNYCRQLIRHFDANGHKSKPEGLCSLWARGAIKFQLPEGGMTIDDPDLRGIDESLPLRLPFKSIALEYVQYGDAKSSTTKHIIFAQQDEKNERIYIHDVMDIGGSGWAVHDIEFYIPTEGYLDRSEKGYMGYPALRLHDRDFGWLPNDSNYGCQRVLFAFLNALSCSNAHIETVKPRSEGKKIKSALPFDTYHYLTIDVHHESKCGSGLVVGNHRSPREHIRRGHIRRLNNRKIWVNATVVAAGSKGVITKDYRMAA